MNITENQLRDMYINLMRDIIINDIYKDPSLRRSITGKIANAFRLKNRHDQRRAYDQSRRESGLDWPSVAHSMIGRKRMDNLRYCLCNVLEEMVPGDFVETGVWRGGACIFARAIIKSYGDTERTVWVADSFAGLPEPDDTYLADKGDKHYTAQALAVSQAQVAANFEVYGLLDDQVKFLEGWFKDTLPKAPIEKIAVLRLDGDMYESTMDALKALYHKVSPGGYVIVDDYYAVDGCRQAVHDFLDEYASGETADIQEIDGSGVFWRRGLN